MKRSTGLSGLFSRGLQKAKRISPGEKRRQEKVRWILEIWIENGLVLFVERGSEWYLRSLSGFGLLAGDTNKGRREVEGVRGGESDRTRQKRGG